MVQAHAFHINVNFSNAATTASGVTQMRAQKESQPNDDQVTGTVEAFLRQSVRLWNSGAVTIFVKFGTATATAATTDTPIPPGASPEIFEINQSDTHIATITASSTGTLYGTLGTGSI